MSKRIVLSPQVAFRLPPELLRQLDRYADEQQKKLGIRWTRTDAVRALIKVGLECGEKKRSR